MVLLLAGCQTAGSAPAAKSAPTATAAPRGPSSITLTSAADMLSALVREASPMINQGGVVLVNGTATRVAPAQNFRGASLAEFADGLARAGQLIRVDTGQYQFLYPQGYEVLAQAAFPVTGPLAQVEASAVFGEGTKIYNALGILSQSLGVSLVGDNIVAEIPSGEISLRDAPLSAVIEALLRSARATTETVTVESDASYLFLRATSNAAPADNLLNAAALSPEQLAKLDAEVSLVLPEVARRPGSAVFIREALPLGDLLGSLSKQLGLTVTAAPELRDLPVNYTVLNKVSVRNALNLIVRQWPVPKFGFTFDGATLTLQGR